MADRRLILLRDYPPLVGRAEADQRLIDYLPSVPASSVLLFYCVQKTDARKKLYAAIKKMDGVVSFQPLKDLALTSFVVRAFRSQGRACDERTADLLICISGGDTARLLSEVAKIAALHPEEPSVSPEDVKALAVPSTESRIFSLTVAVVAGQNGKAFSLLRSLLLSGEDRVGILAMLLRQYRRLQHVKIMQYEKRGNDFIRQSLGVPAFAAGQYIRQAASYTGSQVKEAVRLCLAADEDFKTGRLNPEGGLETVMLKLLMLRKPAP
jgi:DNA polymerase-3 subunit delta